MTSSVPIDVDDVSVTFNRSGVITEALRNVTFALDGAGWFLVSGPNGSGKSTLLSVLAGDVAPSAGEVRVFGKVPLRLTPKDRAKTVTIVRQRPEQGLVLGFTVEEHCRLFGMSWLEFLERIARLGGGFEIVESLRRKQIEYLSGGERQVVGLSLQLIRPSPVLLLDEPFAALDPARLQAMLAIVKGLAQTRTVVQVTHEPEMLRPFATRELALSKGQVVIRDLLEAESHV